MIPKETVERILDTAQIVDVVGDFVSLKRRGANFVACCPFHNEKTPSFYVSPAKGIYKCFGCGKSGTAVGFVMEHENLSYTEALRYLARKYGIEVVEKEESAEEIAKRQRSESLYLVSEFAAGFFRDSLSSGEGRAVGYAYFKSRGLEDATIEKFGLGWAPTGKDALSIAAREAGYREEFLIDTGLSIKRDNGTLVDRFFDRVIFPIHSVSGRVIAFGGRTLRTDKTVAKYVNSPETEIYVKSKSLYGIYFAKNEISRQDRCYLVEGYTDVISMHQAGVENVVASSGTALTQGQIRLIHRFTNNITVLYDGDAAGIKAAIRGIDLLLEEGMNVKVLLLPDGEDPDSFARSHSATEFGEYIKANETDFIRFKTKLLMEEAGSDPIRRSQLINDIVSTISVIPDTIARSVYIRECSSTMEIDEQVLLNAVNKIRLSKRETKREQSQSQPPRPNIPAFADDAVNNYVYPPELASQEIADVPEPPSDFPTPPPASDEVPQESGPQDVPPPEPEPEQHPTSQPRIQRSPFEAYEINLLRYIIRYGEQLLYDYVDEESGEPVRWKVAEYIKSDLEQDNLTFYNPLFKQILDEAAEHCQDEGFVAHRYFLAHPDPLVSQLAANLISEKYQLSKYHSKFHELEDEKDMLDQLVIRDIFALKDAYIIRQIKETLGKMKEAQAAGNWEQAMALMKELTRLNDIKAVLSKELGERIILKM